MVPSSSRHGSQRLVGTPAWQMQGPGRCLLLMMLLLADRMAAQLWRALGCHPLQELLWRALGGRLLQELLLLPALVESPSQLCPACALGISRARRLKRPASRPGPSSIWHRIVRCWQLQGTQVPPHSRQAQGEEAQPVLLADQHQPQHPALSRGKLWARVCSTLRLSSESRR